MKRTKRVSICVFLTLCVWTTAGKAGLADGLIGYWPLNGSWNDESGKNNTLIPVNGASLGSGRFGGGAFFDGVNDYAKSAGQLPLVEKNTFSASIWVSPINNSNYETAAQILGAAPGGNLVCASFNTGIPFATTSITVRSYTTGWYAGGNSGALGPYTWEIVGPPTVDSPQWTHLATTWQRQGDNVTATFYVNGQAVGTRTSGLLTFVNVPTWVILGNHSWLLSTTWYKGGVDDLAVWNRALTPQEVLAIAQGAAVPEPATFGFLAFATIGVFTRRIRQ